MRTPEALDARTLELHRRVAEKLRREPALFNKALENLCRWRGTASAATLPYLEEWQRILDQGMEAALAKAVEESEHAACLRKSSPFAGVLSEEERLTVLKSFQFPKPETPENPKEGKDSLPPRDNDLD